MKPILKLYRGYTNGEELIVMGHVFKPTTKKDYDFQKKNFKNATSVIKMFTIKTQANADVYLDYNGYRIRTKTLDDGYFKFSIPLQGTLPFGWNTYKVSIYHNDEELVFKGSYVHPSEGKWGIISDIDDTFLVSHSSSFFRKLYVLLFKNLNNRKIFEDVVHHYDALSRAGTTGDDERNAFFYVSSSEWNLYRFITQFAVLHKLPKAVLLLKDIKTGIADFFFSGRGDHNHKFEKIKHILELYPKLKFILLGDDTQHDPYLYQNLCKIFPITVKAVYIRQTGSHPQKKTVQIMENLESLGVESCYFKHSSEAIAHSKKIGII
jgi:phosphatidate phosphatase APP1